MLKKTAAQQHEEWFFHEYMTYNFLCQPRPALCTATSVQTMMDFHSPTCLKDHPSCSLLPLTETLLTAFIGHFTLGSRSRHQTAYSSQTEESNWSVKEGEGRCTKEQNRMERWCVKEPASVIGKGCAEVYVRLKQLHSGLQAPEKLKKTSQE